VTIAAHPLCDLSDPAFWAGSPATREAGFARLREQDPVSWHRQPESTLGPTAEDAGFWAVTGWGDIRTVSRDPGRFCSGQGRLLDDIPPELLDQFESIIAMDDPAHARLRRLVSSAFSPRTMRTLERRIAADAQAVIDDLGEDRDGDFVDRVAKRLPMLTVLRMLGVTDDRDAELLAELTEGVVCYSDHEALGGREPAEVMGQLLATIHELAGTMARARRERPAEDVMSALVHAEVDGRRLQEGELVAFFTLLSIAGNDTTKQTTSIAMRTLCEHPDQRRTLQEELDGRIDSAVEEFVRWATPVAVQRRTATREVELAGRRIGAGEKVALLLSSGNRDRAVFAEADRFDVGRDPNPHLGFGGGGPHYCMGAALARVSLRALFTCLLTRYPEIEVGEPRWVTSNNVNGILRMAMDTGPRRG
jgi:cytochrome P450